MVLIDTIIRMFKQGKSISQFTAEEDFAFFALLALTIVIIMIINNIILYKKLKSRTACDPTK